MAADDTKGFDSKTQKSEQLEALKVEYEMHKRFGRDDRAKEVAAYAKQYHGETFKAKSSADKDDSDDKPKVAAHHGRAAAQRAEADAKADDKAAAKDD